MILHKIVDCGPEVLLSDISGQEWAKRVFIKMVILPTEQPQLFRGLRAPPKGLLIFGPSGNRKYAAARQAQLPGQGDK
ncbi:hypothetical protein MRX96_014551 [Rhipicephalus microplus]